MQRRNTNQRKIVYDALAELGHASIETLIEYLKMHNENISLATIYRNVNILLEENKIKRVKIASGDVLETIKEEHCHFVCEKCGEIIDYSFDEADLLKKAKQYGMHQIKKCDLTFYGLCQKCEKKEKEYEVRL